MILKEEASIEQLPLLAEKIKKNLETPCVVILTGEIGSGKTTFVQFFAGQSGMLTSPTYSLINTIDDIVHADFYRIESENDLKYLEISLYDECQYAFIEWGRPFLHYIKQEFSSRFLYFELKIQENHKKTSSRVYILNQC